MKRPLRFVGWTLLLSLLLGTALVLVAVSLAGGMEHAVIELDGEPVNLSQLGAGHWLVAFGGAALALLVAAVVVPLAVLLPLGIVAVVLAGVALVLAGVAALVCSPLILAGLAIWLVVRLLRRRARARGSDHGGHAVQRAPAATITG